MRRRITLDKIHKYAGLVAALWMAVLAVTGMMQLNRQGWDWLWASGPALDESHAGHDDKNLWRYHQIDPANPATRVAGGAAGAFLSENGGKGWTRLPFGDAPIRNVQAMEPVAGPDGWTVYVGTSDGVWRLDRATKRFVPHGLQGKMVNSLSVEGDRIIAAVRMSQLFQRALDPDKMAWEPVKLAPLAARRRCLQRRSGADAARHPRWAWAVRRDDRHDPVEPDRARPVPDGGDGVRLLGLHALVQPRAETAQRGAAFV